MTFFEQSVFFGVSVSLAAYGIGVLLQKKFKFALFNLSPSRRPSAWAFPKNSAAT